MPKFEEGQAVFILNEGKAVPARIRDPRPRIMESPHGRTTTAYRVERRTPDFRRIAWIDEQWIFTDEESANEAVARKQDKERM